MSTSNPSAPSIGEVLDSLHAALVTLPEDLALDHRKAWLFAILCGWNDDALASVARRHGWSAETVARVRSYREVVRGLQPPRAMR